MPTFTPPIIEDVPRILPDTRGPAFLLMRHYRNLSRGRSVVWDGTHFQTVDIPTTDQLVAAGAEGTGYFLGGHDYTVGNDLAGLIVADGYGVVGYTNTLTLPGSGSNRVSTPDSAANSIPGDIDLRIKVAPVDWTPSGAQALMAKVNASGVISWQWYLDTNGTLNFTVVSGSAGPAASTVATGFTDGTAHWLRVTRRRSDGRTQHFTSTDGTAWTQLGANVTVFAGISIDDTNAPITIGARDDGGMAFAGAVYYAQLRDGIDGTVVHTFDATVVGRLGTRNPSTVTAGGPWTISGTGWDWTVL
jgi:hypothetical protein